MSQDLHANAAPPEVREADPARGCRRLAGRVAPADRRRARHRLRVGRAPGRRRREVWITDRDEAALAAARVGPGRRPAAAHAGDGLIRAPSDVAAVMADLARAPARSTSWSTTPAARCTRPTASWTRATPTGQQVMNLNLMGAVWASRAVLPAMVAQRFGRIVNFGSKAGRFGSLIAGPNYAAAKGAIAALTRQMAQEFGRRASPSTASAPAW
jgi:NAD(P)-dependent dehydrogenase (short-subunit alcohol dehydrogenase family)